MDNSKHIEDCPCTWCEEERQNADMLVAKEKANDRLAPTAGSPSSDTPETDAVSNAWLGNMMTPWNLARKLERERDRHKAASLSARIKDQW